MYGEITWFSQSRKQVMRIAVNGGSVYYDKIGAGFEKVPEEKRIAVIEKILELDDTIESIFLGDENVKQAY